MCVRPAARQERFGGAQALMFGFKTFHVLLQPHI